MENMDKPSHLEQQDEADSTVNLQNKVREEMQKLCCRRLGIIEIDVAIHHPTIDGPLSYQRTNLCAAMQAHKYTGAHLYVRPTIEEGNTESTINDIPHAILRSMQLSSIQNGDAVRSNGHPVKKMNSTKDPVAMIIICQCSRRYDGKKVNRVNLEVETREDYRASHYRNDRRNNRHGAAGRRGPQQTITNRNFGINTERCPFSIKLYHGINGYYVNPAYGCCYHDFHFKRDHLRTPGRLISSQAREVMNDMNSSRSLAGSAVNMYYNRSKRKGLATLLSKSQVRYICNKNQGEPGLSQETEKDDMASLYDFLEGSGCSYISLLERIETSEDETIRKSILFNECQIESNPLLIEQHNFGKLEEEEATRITSIHREECGILDQQEMMVGIAYSTPHEVKQFQLFHAVLHIDATADSNKEGRPLLTVTGKDSCGRMYTALRAFLPCEQGWAFKWLFQLVFPALLGKDYLSLVQVVITDGDIQLISQLENCISEYLPNTYRIRCSWHIVDRGWQNHVKVPLGGFSRKKRQRHLLGSKRKKPAPLTEANRMARNIYRWMFSWAMPGFCINREEFRLSRALFLYVVQSDDVKTVLGSDAVKLIVDFARNFVLIHEENFCYYARHSKFHLESHTNSCHEGTNNGIKHCAAPVMPQNRISRAVETLAFNSEIKASEIAIQLCTQVHGRSLWSNTPTADHVTSVCESMLIMEWRLAADWVPVRAERFRWLVHHRNDSASFNGDDESWEGDWLNDDSDNPGDTNLSSGQGPKKFGKVLKGF